MVSITTTSWLVSETTWPKFIVVGQLNEIEVTTVAPTGIETDAVVPAPAKGSPVRTSPEAIPSHSHRLAVPGFISPQKRAAAPKHGAADTVQFVVQFVVSYQGYATVTVPAPVYVFPDVV